MKISELAERCGVPATTLRFYESAGLLPADRTAAGYRAYGEDAVDRLAFIGAAKHLGLPLAEIGELLAVWEGGACHEVKADLRPRIAARLDESEHRVAELTAFTASLHAALEHLDALPDRAGPCDSGCAFGGPLVRPAADPVDETPAPHSQAAEQQPERWRSAPVACSLAGDSITERVRQWHQVLDGADRSAITDGTRLTLPADRAGAVAELAAAEQQCCPFFDFLLHFDDHCLHFEVRAPADGAGLLADLFGAAA
ncbi:MerR family transcriptional regulator [Streptomyces sp. NPDC018019]|uniref:MerR family transcriptional regulator n=1 Tax=Streptomyces sp. NPDC018019 TaxID=3365030 RepID=UPI0037B9F0F0